MNLEQLESKLCLSSPYSFAIVAQSQSPDQFGKTMTGFSSDPSINDAGMVAVVAKYADGQGIIVGNGTPGSLKNINPGFSHSSNRTFSPFVEINSLGQVVAIDRVSASPPTSYLRTWNASATNSFADLARAGNPGQPLFGPWDAVLASPAMNNKGDVVFPTLVTTGNNPPSSLIDLDLHSAGASVNTAKVLEPLTTPQALRPQISDNGMVVVRDGNTSTSPILLIDTAANRSTMIADPKDFTALGSSPGISADGSIVTFYGELSAAGAKSLNQKNGNVIVMPLQPGPGIFASVLVNGARYIAELSATSQATYAGKPIGIYQNIAALDPDASVAVKTQNGGREADVVFVGTDTTGGGSKRAIYTAALMLYGKTIGIGGPILVAETGQNLAGIAVTTVNLFDALNAKGQIAFWVADSSGKQAIIEASPQASASITAVRLRQIMSVNGTSRLTTAQANRDLVALNWMFREFGLTTAKRQAAFLGQAAEESTQLTEWLQGGGTEGSHPSPNQGRGPLQLTGSVNYNWASQYFGINFTSHLPLVSDETDHPEIGFLTSGAFWSVEPKSKPAGVSSSNPNTLADSVNVMQRNPSQPDSITTVGTAIGRIINYPHNPPNGIATRLKYYALALHVLGLD